MTNGELIKKYCTDLEWEQFKRNTLKIDHAVFEAEVQKKNPLAIIFACFNWKDSPEGHKYWQFIFREPIRETFGVNITE